MEFFNRKEEVIDIQLTQYGKHLLSKGKFKPTFYAFYDDDILYNTHFGGFGEEQRASEDRIKETPRTKTQHNYSNRDTGVKSVNKSLCDDDMPMHEKTQTTAEKNYSMGIPLGTSALGESKAPAWSVVFLNGTLSGSSEYIKAERETTNFEFTSGTKTDYEDSSGENGKFIDITNTLKETYRFYFDAGNSPSAPNKGSHSNPATLVSVDISSESAATGIAGQFRTAVNSQKDLEATLSTATVTVQTKNPGPAKNSKVNNISDISMDITKQGRTGSRQLLKIPQLDVDSYIDVKIVHRDDTMAGFQPDPANLEDKIMPYGTEEDAGPLLEDSPIFADDTQILIEPETVLLEINEINGFFEMENFDVEIFKIEEDEVGVEQLLPMSFVKEKPQVINNILLDQEQYLETFSPKIGRCSVEYFMDIAIDDEIDETVLSRRLLKKRTLLEDLDVGTSVEQPAVGYDGPAPKRPGDVYLGRDRNEEEPCE